MKNKIKRQKREIAKATIALYQILILVVATIAFSWMIGSQIETVSADGGATSNDACYSAGGNCINITSTPNCIGEKRVGLCYGYEFTCCVPYSQNINDDEVQIEPEKDKFSLSDAIAVTTTIASLPENIKNANKALEAIKNIKFGPKTGGAATGNALDTEIAADIAANDAYIQSLEIKPIRATFGDYFKFGNPSLTSTNLAQIASNAFYAAIVVAVIIYFANKYASERNAGDLTTVTLVGAGAGMLAATIWSILATEVLQGPPGWLAAAVTLVAAAIYMVVGYQLYSQEVFTYRSGLWQPPTGGAECSKCNSLIIAGENECSKYICHSYGAACDWVNDETEYETCIEVNPGDISPSVIEPAKNIYGEDVFQNNQYDYRTSSTGARIVYSGEGGETGLCIPAFTPIKLALTTNENAHCKISLEPTTGTSADAFSTMQDMAEGTAYTKNHTLQLPSSVSANQDSLAGAGYSLNNGGTFKFYVRCEDVRGNINTIDYMMQFCVQMGPDLRPPEITGSNPAQNSYIAYNTSIIKDFQIYTNEPADCKWDTKEVNYPYMNNNFTKCSQRVDDYLVGFEYGCQVNLTGFKNGIENKYYVACIDHPELKGTAKQNQRNIMRPYEVILKGTNRLVIQNVMINGKSNGTSIKGPEENANVRIEVLTSGGAEEGNARCLYTEDSTNPNSYSLFSNDGSREYLTTNTEELYMPQGIYKYFIKCFDVADNFVDTMINFSVEVDNFAPSVVRVYKDEETDSLKIITDEFGECVFSTTSCNYEIESGTEINTNNGKEHYVDWDSSRDLYIKCIDEFNNRPEEGECSIIIRPFEIVQTIQ